MSLTWVVSGLVGLANGVTAIISYVIGLTSAYMSAVTLLNLTKCAAHPSTCPGSSKGAYYQEHVPGNQNIIACVTLTNPIIGLNKYWF